jgi:hypothetical protein
MDTYLLEGKNGPARAPPQPDARESDDVKPPYSSCNPIVLQGYSFQSSSPARFVKDDAGV